MKTEMNKNPSAAAPNMNTVLNENEKVRVLEVVFKPGDTTPMHHHPDHVVYALKGGRLRVTSEGKTQEMELQTGSATFFTAQDHIAANIGNTEIDLIVVELKK